MLKKIFTTDRLIGLGILTIFLLLAQLDPFPVQYLREKSFDIYQKIKPRTVPPPEDRLVTIIDVDEKSLREIGQWPWSRKTIAQLVANLHNMGVAVMAFDVVFPEADRMNPASLVESLDDIGDDLRNKILAIESNDEIFSRITGQASVVLGRAGHWDRNPNSAVSPPKTAIAIRKLSPESPDPSESLVSIPTLISNLPQLEKNASGIGIFAFKPELDGVVRQVPIINQHHDSFYPSLAIEAIRVGLQVPTMILEVDPNGIHALGVAPPMLVKPDGLKIKTDENGQVRPYFAPHDQSIYISAVDVLKQRIDESKLAGKIAFIGSSAAGLLDIRSTPVSFQIPGVEIHAQVVENALALDRQQGILVPANQFLARSRFVSRGSEILLIGCGGLLMIFLTPLLGATRSMFVFFTLACCTIGGSWYLFSQKHILMDATFGVLSSLLLYSALTYLSLTREEQAKQQIRSAFSMYLSPDMVNVVAENPDQLQLGGQKRKMTLLFCDVRGFTTISEMFDAEGLTHLINRLLTPLTNIILSHQGTVDKYMGDCIMAFWNAPLDDPQHARNGCVSALKMIGSMDQLNKDLKQEAEENNQPYIPLKVGIGLNSGECVVGNMGSDQRFDYSVLGDPVNLAARLEGQSKNYGVDIVIGADTRAHVPMLATLELDLIKVKGKTEAVHIFGLIGDETMADSKEFKTLKNTVDTMLAKWRTQQWDDAEKALARARDLAEPYTIDGFFDLYEQRLIDYQLQPPGEDWDGVFIATTK
ncbi:MAG: adenylate/guanylate cyclase domain-containing protein [Thermodesulfobacteriota bacterium]